MARKKQKLKTFTNTCDKDYDRHKYKLVTRSGKGIILEDYEMARQLWYQYRHDMVRLDVLDK